ncbi:Zinc finger, GRF-type [Sesbania bispinosa]|nr:Zinc finger, GRF-type [Sesbania bispinosa]
MKAKTCASEQRYSASKSSSSSSISRRLFCACGDNLLLLKSSSQSNPGRMFWRCPNWAEATCKYFRWADDVVCDEGVRVEEWKKLKHENEELKRKNGKLQLKLSCERRRLKLAVCAVVLLMGLFFMVFAVAIVNCGALRKTM